MKRLIACLLLITLSLPYITGKNHNTGLRVLFIGDSITDGNWGGGGKASAERNHWDKNHLFGSGYMYLCAAEFTGHYPEANLEFFNRGISGNTLDDLYNRWEEDVLNICPDVLSILIGINDVSHAIEKSLPAQFDIKIWEQKYRFLLDQALAQNPNIQIVLAQPFAINISKIAERFNERMQLLAQCTEVIYKIAKDYKAIFLPYQSVFDEAIRKYNVPPSHWIWDGIHPTVSGHQLMADLWVEKTKNILLSSSLPSTLSSAQSPHRKEACIAKYKKRECY